MTFLPIVERELRIAARRPGTYRTRWLAALGMMGVWVLLAAANRRMSAAELSKTQFIALGVLALGFCLLAGIFLTADCLSEEKREGTLGLLFLTDLRGYDVVLGKLIATSVHSVYGLLAMFPVLALPLLMGGVTVGEFWRVVLVLVATLFFSLSMGMFVSALVREARQAMAGTFLGLVVLAGALPALWWLGNAVFKTKLPGILLWPSAVTAFGAALDASYRVGRGPSEFWLSLQTVSWLALGLLVTAALLLPRAWQDRAGRPSPQLGAGKPRAAWSDESNPPFIRLSQSLESNPYFRLASRARSFGILPGLLLGLLVLIWLASLAASVVTGPGKQSFVICLLTGYALHQAGKYLVAVEATRQFSEDRRSGALELLLVTPLGEAQILLGQKVVLRQRFHGLKWGLLLVNLCMGLVVLGCPHQLMMSPTDQAVFVEIFLGGMLAVFVDFMAIQWIGIWMSLRAQRQQRAVLGTLSRVMLMPWAAIFLLVFLMITGGFRSSEGAMATIVAIWFSAGIVSDLVFLAQARAGLDRGLRYWVAEALHA